MSIHTERVNRTFLHMQPDRIPVSLGTTIVDGMSRYAKANYEIYKGKPVVDPLITSRAMQTAAVPEWVLEDLDCEFRPVRMIEAFTDNTEYTEDGFTDGYGIFWKKTDLYFDPTRGPWQSESLSLDDIKNNPWINAYIPKKIEGMKKRCREIRESGHIVVADMMSFGPFEHALWMRGYENFLCDLYSDEKTGEAILDRTTQGGMELFDAMLSEIGDDIDIVCHGDDMGMQDRSLISPEIYDKLILKYHKKQIDFIKSKTTAKVFFHSCGSIHSLIPGLIEAGVDIINPIQTSAWNMEPERLKNDFGHDIVFWGGIDTQKILPDATENEVRDEIKRLLDVLGKDGGYVIAPSHNLQSTLPPERIQLMIDCLKNYR